MERCFHCNSLIFGSHYTDLYNNHCCKKHVDQEESVGYCSECLKLVPKRENLLKDGRIVCGECLSIAVSPDRSFDWILKQVLARLFKAGFEDLKVKNITIWTATSEEMAMYKEGGINVFNEGFCSITENGKIKIYIQSHHTKIHFAGVLAHELLHAWCFQQSLFNVPPPIVEGMCNLASYFVYHSIDFPLARIYESMLFADEDPVYGDGFKAMYQVYNEHGWNGVRTVVINSNN